jgi:hypothetical protein
MTEKPLGHGAATDVAGADEQDGFHSAKNCGGKFRCCEGIVNAEDCFGSRIVGGFTERGAFLRVKPCRECTGYGGALDSLTPNFGRRRRNLRPAVRDCGFSALQAELCDGENLECVVHGDGILG